MKKDELDRRRRSRSLEELESSAWGPPRGASHVARSVDAFRRKPIGELSTEELRLLIGQDVGRLFLVPLALVERDPLAEGDFLPGDLLLELLRADASFGERQRELRARLRSVAERTLADAALAAELDEPTRRELAERAPRLA